MSVPVNERSHGKLEAYFKAFELATYTLKITANKKVFTVEYQEQLTDLIIKAALEVYLMVGDANDLIVKTEKDHKNFLDRIDLQKQAVKKCSDLNKLILLAKPIFHLSSKRVKYWVGLTNETKSLIKAWCNSDYKRFSSLFEDRGVG